MKDPEIPDHPAITIEQAATELMDSIAKEEEALSYLLRAEANRNLTFAGEDLNFPMNPSNDHIIQYCQSINKIIEAIFMKEWLLYQKLHQVLQIKEKASWDG